MPDSSELLSLYQEWLEIPPHRLPPNHYALLGVDDFESDLGKIEAAAKNRSAYLHQLAAGPERKIVQEMLSQVAVARRTLLSPESKDAYDQTLRQPQAPDPSREPTRARSRKAGEWKLHTVSAAVLLAVVGGIYWANRDSGGRRAAQVDDQVSSSPKDASAVIESVRQPNQLAAPQGNSTRESKSPIAQKRSIGSGLGARLDGEFNDVLSDISTQRTSETEGSENRSSQTTGFRPWGGIAIGKVRKQVKEWPSGLLRVQGFPNAIQKHFESSSGFDWFDVEQGRVMIKANDQRAPFVLTAPGLSLAKGSVVSIETSIHQSSPDDVRVGFIIDGIQIGLRRYRKGVDVYVREQGAGSKPQSMVKISTGAKTATLLVERNSKRDDRLDWFVRTDDKDRAGSVDANLDEHAATEVFAIPPKKKSSVLTWISNLKFRESRPDTQ